MVLGGNAAKLLKMQRGSKFPAPFFENDMSTAGSGEPGLFEGDTWNEGGIGEGVVF